MRSFRAIGSERTERVRGRNRVSVSIDANMVSPPVSCEQLRPVLVTDICEISQYKRFGKEGSPRRSCKIGIKKDSSEQPKKGRSKASLQHFRKLRIFEQEIRRSSSAVIYFIEQLKEFRNE